MIGLFRRLFQHGPTKLTINGFRRYYINKRIVDLEREYADLIKKPYQAGRLSEIISELGSVWNERMRYEDIDSAANINGAKSLWQVQNDVSNIVQQAKQEIARAQRYDDKFIIFIEGLLKLSYVLDEWET